MSDLLTIADLHVRLDTDHGEVHAVRGVDLTIAPGEVVALVGESGSGKTITARAILGLLPETARATGRVDLGGDDMLTADAGRLRTLRGSRAAMVFQEPSTALNPVYPIGWQIAEGLRAHGVTGRKARRERAIEALADVGIPEPRVRADHYPHQFSGGQKQRIMIAAALALEAGLIVADEPTSALDVTVQAEILDLLRAVRAKHGTAILMITHNMGVVADIADRVAVMRQGVLVEQATAVTLFGAPSHAYTRQLLAAIPELGSSAPAAAPSPMTADAASSSSSPTAASSPPPAAEPSSPSSLPPAAPSSLPTTALPPATAASSSAHPAAPSSVTAAASPPPPAPSSASPGASPAVTSAVTSAAASAAVGEAVVDANRLGVTFPGRLGRPSFRAVHEVDLRIHAGEVVGLVGESGSGKTTIGRAVAGLTPVTGGSLTVLGERIDGRRHRRSRTVSAQIGFVFQDPATSFNPQLSVGDSLAEPFLVHRRDLDRRQIAARVAALLDHVALPADYARRYPHELSGGQRQRASVARAIALEPRLLIADEPTSALDVSVQATILDLILRLHRDMGFAALFISHDLAVIETVASRVVVLHRGEAVEHGDTAQVLHHPAHAYTRRLVAAVPVPDPTRQAARRAARATDAASL
ncbi:dipeptide ABC transporter ATP-binding protein [Catenuloplanes sp. NPDC051500]|uniref:dipeptide ABC transporter ATP-binding protein n=1 Tax=Catenuloplanes sp. NPDC051500 TaxID=3363959 RepID=UPI0037B84D52